MGTNSRGRLTKAGRIASDQELRDVRSFRTGHKIRLSKTVRDLYNLPVKIKKQSAKKQRPQESTESMLERYLGINL